MTSSFTVPSMNNAVSLLHLPSRFPPIRRRPVRPIIRGRRLCVVMCVVGIGFCALRPIAAQSTSAEAPYVVVSTVAEQDIQSGQTFVGTVMPLRHSTVGSAVEGEVIEFLVREGDTVARLQPLARLRTTSLEIALVAAEAERDTRKHELAELKNGTRPEEIAQAQARMLAAEAQMNYNQAKFERDKSLYGRRAVSEETFQDSSSLAVQSTQSYLTAKAAYDLAVLGPRVEQIAQAEARLAAQEAEIRRIREQIERSTIVVPFDGYVTVQHTEVGQWIDQGDPVAEVVEVDQVEVVVQVLGDDAADLRVGVTATVQLAFLNDRMFTGPVTHIVPQADVRSRSFPVKVRLKNPRERGRHLLRPGMFARVTLPVGKRERALFVPKDALVLGGRWPEVWVVKQSKLAGSGPTVAPVDVEIGASVDGLILVKGELVTGQQVVIEGNERLRSGEEVRIIRHVPFSSFRGEAAAVQTGGANFQTGSARVTADEPAGPLNPPPARTSPVAEATADSASGS